MYDCTPLTQAGSTKYDWDSNGNLIGVKDGQTTWDYTYDFENRLIVVKVKGLVQNKPNHDAEGRRLRLWNSQAGYVNHVYSGLDIILNCFSSACTKHFYAYGLHEAENRLGCRIQDPNQFQPQGGQPASSLPMDCLGKQRGC